MEALVQSLTNHLSPNIYQQNIIEAYYNNLLLQNPELLLLEQLLITQSQSQACLSGQFWQNLVAQAAAAKSKELSSGVSNQHFTPDLGTWKKSNKSFDITTTPLNQNLESSAINKLNSTQIKNRQNISTKSAVSKNGAENSGQKKIHKNDHESRNQLEIQTEQRAVIQLLHANDCAFDSNDEHDLEDNEKASLEEKGKSCQEKRAQLQQEELKDNSLIVQK